MQRATFSDVQEPVRYMVLNEYEADVIVHKFVREEVCQCEMTYVEDDTEEAAQEYTQYIYDINIFKVDPAVITKEMIEADVDSYMTYSPSAPVTPSIDEKVSTLEAENEFLKQCIIEMSEVLYG